MCRQFMLCQDDSTVSSLPYQPTCSVKGRHRGYLLVVFLEFAVNHCDQLLLLSQQGVCLCHCHVVNVWLLGLSWELLPKNLILGDVGVNFARFWDWVEIENWVLWFSIVLTDHILIECLLDDWLVKVLRVEELLSGLVFECVWFWGIASRLCSGHLWF